MARREIGVTRGGLLTNSFLRDFFAGPWGNGDEILRPNGRRGQHRGQPLQDGRDRAAHIYPGGSSPLSPTEETAMTVTEEGNLSLREQLLFLDNRRVNGITLALNELILRKRVRIDSLIEHREKTVSAPSLAQVTHRVNIIISGARHDKEAPLLISVCSVPVPRLPIRAVLSCLESYLEPSLGGFVVCVKGALDPVLNPII